MTQQTNNEIDLLLRRLGRRGGSGVPDVDADHLDADELNAYAENALPAAARTRYAKHLADCSRCRDLVVQLSAAAGLVAAAEPSKVIAPAGLRAFLASLFSPMVLRYAVPALGLIVVAVIGFSFFRSRENFAPQVAQRTAGPATLDQPTATTPQVNSSHENTQATAGKTAPQLRDNEEKQAKRGEPNGAAAPAAAEPQAQPTETDRLAKAERPASTPANETPPPPKASVEVQSAQPAIETETRIQTEQSQETKARNVSREKAAATARNEPVREEQKKLKDTAAPQPSAAKSKVDSDSVGGFIAGRRPRADEKDKDAAETRSVGGRRFRKQDGVWVDTAYESGSATVNVTRGSEQYRALVADEPGIKTIADQLDGQIIVVWKGRAYKIR